MEAVGGLGLDAGSTTCKAVAVSQTGALVAWRLEPADPRGEEQAQRLCGELLDELGAEADVPVVATGYGRKLVRGAKRAVTEISCHARGVFEDLGRGGTLVDIGGQDSKVIVIGPTGKAVDFAMNDKCAAGTGRFLENTAARLNVRLEELGSRALAATSEESISSTCTVFAESEVVSLIALGSQVDPILKGLHRSLIGRVAALLKSVGIKPPLMLSGGGALNTAVKAMLEDATGQVVLLPSHPQLMGAYGAALLACEQATRQSARP